jgi:capsid assembly protease
MTYPHIAARIFNTALLIHPQKLDAIIAGLGERLLGSRLLIAQMRAAQDVKADMLEPEMFSTRRGERTDAGYRMVDGVAVVGINGALVHRSKMDANSNYLLGYNDMAARLEDAMANPDAHAVLQVWDSPGGEAQGAFEFGQRALELRGKKPMYSIADGMAASAAYLGASAAEHVAVTPTGYAGSIGVVMRHVDFSRALANDGIAVTHIFAGAHKVDGNPFEALPAAVRADIQAEINSLYDMFTSAVARHMGLDLAAVRGTEARTFMGQAAVDAGLAHRVATTDQLITELSGLRSRTYPVQSARSSADSKGASMSGNNTAADGTNSAPQATATAGAPTQAAAPAFTAADVDRARAEGVQQGVQQGLALERARVGAILGHQAAAVHPPVALQCISGGLSAEQSTAILAALPAQSPTGATGAANNAFATAMAATGNPKVSGMEGKGEAGDEAALATQILASFSAGNGTAAH